MSRAAVARRAEWMDAVGVGLLVLCIGWTFVSAITSGGDAIPVAALFAGVGLAVVAARLLSIVWRPLAPLLATAAGGLFAAASWPEVVSARPLVGPFGYANARGAFFALLAIGALMLASASESRALRAMGIAAAIGFAAIPIVGHVIAAAALVVLLPIPSMLLGYTGSAGARVAIVGTASLLALALAATVTLGATYPGPPPTRLARNADTNFLGWGRLGPMHDAVELALAQPVTGVGPGEFETSSPIARSDPDHRWAHNAVLQQAAEGGFPAGALLVALFAWGFATLFLRSPDATGALAAAALALVGIQGSVDYVLHFPAVALLAAALAGVGMAGSNPARAVGGASLPRTTAHTRSTVAARSSPEVAS